MTVKELIKVLAKHPQDAKVYFDNQEFGPEELKQIEFQNTFTYPQGGGLGNATITDAVWLIFD